MNRSEEMVKVNIYFICTGNTCRSPMAEAILRGRNIEAVEVRSAGIHALPGMPISAHAKTLVENGALPYTDSANAVTKGNIEWANHILTMTDAHKQVLHRLFPNEAYKIETLKKFIGHRQSSDVHDPFGGDLLTYRQTFEELSILMEKLERKLVVDHPE